MNRPEIESTPKPEKEESSLGVMSKFSSEVDDDSCSFSLQHEAQLKNPPVAGITSASIED